MKNNLVAQLADDISWIYSLQPRDQVTPLASVMRLLYWHLIQKKLGRYHIGKYFDNFFLYDHASDGCATAYITPHYDYSIQHFIQAVLKPKSIFVDIGANVGTETLLAAKAGAVTHSFEPTPDIFSLLQINVLLNGYNDNCILQQAAVSNKTGHLSFFVYDDGHQLLNSLVKQDSPQQKNIKVKAIKLDDYFKEQKITSADLLKVDVEGAEALVFAGSSRLLKQGKLPAIIWESNLQATDEQRASTRKLLDMHGYKHFWWNVDKRTLEPWSNQENCFSLLSSHVNRYQKLLKDFRVA